jgi:acyl-ACP thioesterase
MRPRPAGGRVFTTEVRVRLGDVDPSSTARLDALARFLQDVSSDDTADADPDDRMLWVVRRTSIEVHRPLGYRELLEASTWCSGLGSRWAERRVSLVGDRGGRVEASSLWVCIDKVSSRPAKLPEDFTERYGVSPDVPTDIDAKLRLPKRPEGLAALPWPLRQTDFDALDHVNNAAYWSVAEQLLVGRRPEGEVLRGDLEYGAGIDPGDEVEVCSLDGEDGAMTCWLSVGGSIRATARVQAGLPPTAGAGDDDGEGAEA